MSKVEDSENSEKKQEDPDKYDGKKKGGEAWSDGKNGTPKEYDPTFNGPIKDRGCTDIICCILFLVCFLGMGVVGYWAYAYGDPYKLLYPSDSDENLCGYGAYENMPNLFFFDLIDCAKVGPAIVTNGCPTKQICVTECPSEYWTWYVQYAKEKTAEIAGVLSTAAVTARAGRDKLICDYGVDATSAAYASAADLDALITNGTCAGYYYPQEPVLGRCLPSFISEALDKTKDLVATVGSANDTEIRDASNSTVSIGDIFSGSGFISNLLAIRSYGEKMLADVMNAKWFILGGLGLSMVISFLWIVVMRWIAGIIVWVTIACFTALFVFSTYYCYSTYYEMKNDNVTSGALIFTTDLSYYLTLEKTWLAFGCTSATLLAILLLIILVLRQRILIAIALIKEGSRAIGMMIFTLLWPIWPFIMQLSLVAYWGAACLYLASTSQKIYGTTNSSALNTNKTFDWTLTSTTTQATDLIPCDPNANNTVGEVCSFVKNDVSEYTLYLQIYMLFMFFWVMNWIIGFGQMVLAGAFASYYWAYDKKEHMPVFPILGSVGRTLFYHTGSIAFGAFIIALIQIIRVGLEYLDSKLKGSGNEVAKFLLKCLKCCFWCLEKFMKMINKNAYIMIAVYGKNFCTAAKDAFFLIMRNIVRVAVVDKVTDFLMFMSKLVVTAAIVLIAYFFFNGTIGNTLTFLKEYEVDLNYYFIPIIIIGIGSFVIASCFFSVYGMAVDTLFLCFLEDLERNDGSAEKPYYMSKELKEILGKKNVVPSKED